MINFQPKPSISFYRCFPSFSVIEHKHCFVINVQFAHVIDTQNFDSVGRVHWTAWSSRIGLVCECVYELLIWRSKMIVRYVFFSSSYSLISHLLNLENYYCTKKNAARLFFLKFCHQYFFPFMYLFFFFAFFPFLFTFFVDFCFDCFQLTNVSLIKLSTWYETF